jgi:glucokinase
MSGQRSAHAVGAPAIEVGGSHAVAALADLTAGTLVPGTLHKRAVDPRDSAPAVIASVVGAARGLPPVGIERWGVAIPGPFDYQRGVGLFTGVGKFESLYGVDVGAALMGDLPGPPAGVAFLNDAAAFGWGEWLFGAGKRHERGVFLTLGTGVGSAFLADGALKRDGPGVPPQGEAHLLTIDGRPLEDTVSTRAVEREYHRRTSAAREGAAREDTVREDSVREGTVAKHADPVGVAEVANLARSGDPVALDVLRTAFRRLGEALGPGVARFEPDVVVVGGGMIGAWDIIGPAFRDGLCHDGGGEITVSIAAQPDAAALLGAAAYAQGLVGAV